MRAQSPCTHTSGMRDQYVSTYRAGSFQKPRVIPGHGLRIASSPTVPRTERPRSSTTSTSMPGTGPEKEHAEIGVHVVQPRMPPATSVPPE